VRSFVRENRRSVASWGWEARTSPNLEAALFLPGLASFQVERSFVVTAAGCRPLARQDRMRPILPAEFARLKS
jgi:hypothetical protein